MITSKLSTPVGVDAAFDWEFDWPEDFAPDAEYNAHYDAIAARVMAGQVRGMSDAAEMTGEFWALGYRCPHLPPVRCEDEDASDDGWVCWGVRDDGDRSYDSWVDDRLTA